jgi:ATP-dependent Clp protease ATP-binding subunit ClpB
MTSNAGSPLILEAAGEGAVDPAAWARTEEQVIGVLRQQFRPEFLNRVDDIIVFHPLSANDIGAIVNIQLARMEKLLADRKLTLELTPEARALIAREGYDPAFGARPLKRAIQRLLQNPLALAVLEGSYAEGDRIRAVPSGDVLTFEKA